MDDFNVRTIVSQLLSCLMFYLYLYWELHIYKSSNVTNQPFFYKWNAFYCSIAFPGYAKHWEARKQVLIVWYLCGILIRCDVVYLWLMWYIIWHMAGTRGASGYLFYLIPVPSTHQHYLLSYTYMQFLILQLCQ